jgi:hypothetical protein
MKEQNWSYMAGLFDGEGCVSITEHTFNDKKTGYTWNHFIFMVQITNTNLDLMRWLVAHFGGKYYIQNRHPKHPNWKLSYRWRPKGRKNEETFLLNVLPYLVVKKEAAKVALEFVRLEGRCPEERRKLAIKLCALNKRGKSVETNTLDTLVVEGVKIESVLVGNNKSDLAVMQEA